MTPKEKAIELVRKFKDIKGTDYDCEYISHEMAQCCAIICISEIQDIKVVDKDEGTYDYWSDVEKEVNKLNEDEYD